MVYEINQDCIACGNCSVVCPRQAIDDGFLAGPVSALASAAGAGGEGGAGRNSYSVWQGYRITEACTGCGACADVCPTGAITRK